MELFPVAVVFGLLLCPYTVGSYVGRCQWYLLTWRRRGRVYAVLVARPAYLLVCHPYEPVVPRVELVWPDALGALALPHRYRTVFAYSL